MSRYMSNDINVHFFNDEAYERFTRLQNCEIKASFCVFRPIKRYPLEIEKLAVFF